MVMLVYASLLLFFMTVTYIQCFLDAAVTPGIHPILFYIIALNLVLTMFLAVIVIMFTTFHFW